MQPRASVACSGEKDPIMSQIRSYEPIDIEDSFTLHDLSLSFGIAVLLVSSAFLIASFLPLTALLV